jgi:hypothetical protein
MAAGSSSEKSYNKKRMFPEHLCEGGNEHSLEEKTKIIT